MSTPKIRPLNDNILVRRKEAEKVTAGGLFVPDDRQVKNRYCEVLAVGPGKYNEKGERVPVNIQPGQVVFIRGTSGREVELDGQKGYLFVNESEVEGIVE